MTLNNIIRVSVSRSQKPQSKDSFGIPLLLTTTKAFTSRVAAFADPDEVLALFPANSAEYAAALTMFSPDKTTPRLLIGRRETTDVATLTVDTAVASTSYTITVDGVAYTVVSDASPTVGEIAGLLVAAVNADGDAVVTAAATSGGSFTLTADVAGVPFSLKVGNRISQALVAADTIAEDMAAIRLENDGFHSVFFNSLVIDDQEDLADYIETADKFLYLRTADSAVVNSSTSADTTSIWSKLSAKDYKRTMITYHSKAATEYIDSAECAFVAQYRPGAWELENQTMVSITPDTLTATQRQNLIDKGVAYYETVAGLGTLQGVYATSGEYPDVMQFIDWLVSDLQLGFFTVMKRPGKVPGTSEGIGLFEAQARATDQKGRTYGGIDPDRESVFTFPKASERSAQDRANRTLTGIKLQFPLSGAIRYTELAVEVID